MSVHRYRYRRALKAIATRLIAVHYGVLKAFKVYQIFVVDLTGMSVIKLMVFIALYASLVLCRLRITDRSSQGLSLVDYKQI